MRKKATIGFKETRSSGGNMTGVKSRPAIGGEPDDPSATSLVYV